MAQYTAPESLHIASGSETVFGFAWPYLVASDIKVTVNDIRVITVLVGTAQVSIQPAPAAGAVVRIYRDTPAQSPNYLFDTGIPFMPRYVDNNNRQLLHAVQEGLLSFQQVRETAEAAVAAVALAQQTADNAINIANASYANASRTVRAPATDPIMAPLAPVALRAGKVMGFDSAGNPIGTLPASGSGTELALDLAGPGGSALVGSTRLEVGATRRIVQDRLNDRLPVPEDFGVIGDGLLAYDVLLASVEAVAPVLYLPQGRVYRVGPGYVPTSRYVGPGVLRIGSQDLSPGEFVYDVYRATLEYYPDAYTDKVGFPTAGTNLSINISPGGSPAGNRNRSTIIGTQGPKQLISVDRLEGYGNGVFMYTRYAERTTALGSIAFQWLGSTNPQADNHQFWSNAGGLIPGDAGWDYNGLETRNPGIGAKIAAFTGYATQPSDCGRSVAVGRDAGNGTVLARNTTLLGYRAGAGCFAVDNVTAVGTDAFRDGILLTNSVAVGNLAGGAWQEGERNFVAGYNAGSAAVRGSRNTLLGSYAASNYPDLNRCIIIGHGAANGLGGTSLTDVLAIGNESTPLISGRMDLATVGINAKPADTKGTLHVRTGGYGANNAAHGLADDLVVEAPDNGGISIRAASDGFSSILFADKESGNQGGLVYSHALDILTFRVAGADRWQMGNGYFAPVASNTQSVGTPSQLVSTVYANTPTIVTSDERMKRDITGIPDAVLDAWGEVEYHQYRLPSADNRLHVGVMAQRVIAAFERHGVDALQYNVVQYHIGVDRYSVCYDEALVLEAAYMRREIRRLKEK